VNPAHRQPIVVQIAPHAEGGVADYVGLLARAWRKVGVDSAVLKLKQDDLRACTLSERLRPPGDARRCVVVLHFSGYGYAPRGLCGWLVDAVQDARRSMDDGVRLLTVFHELHASGPPWRSAFWTSGLQARIAARLAALSDALWTNSTHHGQWLQVHARSGAPVEVAPVFSNVGEAGPRVAPQDREPALLVFGGASTRQRALDRLRGQGQRLRELGVERLVEVGAGPPCRVPPGLPGCERHGRLSLPELQDRLARLRFGLIDYPARHLGKSSVFAGYASHGCVALNTCTDTEPADGLWPGTHYLGLAGARDGAGPARLLATADAAARWYHDHRLAVQAARYLRLIVGLSASATGFQSDQGALADPGHHP
jgi:hypothetical protein